MQIGLIIGAAEMTKRGHFCLFQSGSKTKLRAQILSHMISAARTGCAVRIAMTTER